MTVQMGSNQAGELAKVVLQPPEVEAAALHLGGQHGVLGVGSGSQGPKGWPRPRE
jgi:hypothetical protein